MKERGEGSTNIPGLVGGAFQAEGRASTKALRLEGVFYVRGTMWRPVWLERNK